MNFPFRSSLFTVCQEDSLFLLASSTSTGTTTSPYVKSLLTTREQVFPNSHFEKETISASLETSFVHLVSWKIRRCWEGERKTRQIRKTKGWRLCCHDCNRLTRRESTPVVCLLLRSCSCVCNLYLLQSSHSWSSTTVVTLDITTSGVNHSLATVEVSKRLQNPRIDWHTFISQAWLLLLTFEIPDQ